MNEIIDATANPSNFDQIMTLFGRRGSGRPYTMVHGDFHKENMFMNCTSSGNPAEFGVLDFQLCKAQELVLAEIGWFLTCCVSKITAEEEREMLESYYEKLCNLQPEVKKLWPVYDDVYFHYQISWVSSSIYVQFVAESKVDASAGGAKMTQKIRNMVNNFITHCERVRPLESIQQAVGLAQAGKDIVRAGMNVADAV